MCYILYRRTEEYMGRYKKSEWSGSYERVLILAEKGTPHKDIATEMGLTPGRISQIIHDKRFVARRDKFKEKAEDIVFSKFSRHTSNAASTIIHIMKEGKPQDRIKLDAAKDVLNYAGHKPREHVEHNTYNYNIDEANSARKALEEIDKLQQRLSETVSPFLLGEYNTSGANKVSDGEKRATIETPIEEPAIEGTIEPSPDGSDT